MFYYLFNSDFKINVSSNILFNISCFLTKLIFVLEYHVEKMLRSWAKFEGGLVFEVKIFFLINTSENYILKNFNNTQTRKDFYIIQKKFHPLNFTLFFCEIIIFAIFRCNFLYKMKFKKKNVEQAHCAQNTKTAVQLSKN